MDSRVKNTKNSLINKPSRGLTVVHTRIVTNSTRKRYTDAKHDNKVVSNNTKKKSHIRIVPEGVGAPEVIKCQNRFAVLAEIDQNWAQEARNSQKSKIDLIDNEGGGG